MTAYQQQLLGDLQLVTDQFTDLSSPADPQWSLLQYRLKGITSALFRTGLTQTTLDAYL